MRDPRSKCGQQSSQGSVFYVLGQGVKASFTHSIYGQDKLQGSLIRGVTDPPTEHQGVKANFGQSKFLTVVASRST